MKYFRHKIFAIYGTCNCHMGREEVYFCNFDGFYCQGSTKLIQLSTVAIALVNIR